MAIVPRVPTLPTAWWRHPFILTRAITPPANFSSLLADATPELEGNVYRTGAAARSLAERLTLSRAMQIPTAYTLFSAESHWHPLLRLAGVTEEPFLSALPQLACNLTQRFEAEAHWRMLMVGGAEATLGMHLHVDALPTSSWQLQLQGAKRWLLCPPAARGYCGGGVDDPDAAVAPCGGDEEEEEEAAACLSAAVRPGELLYYPARWWHRTRSAGGAAVVSLSRSLVTPSNAREMAAAVRAFCDRALAVARDAYLPTCQQLMPCAQRWDAIPDG